MESAATREQSGPLMLPMTLQFISVMIASAINDRLQRKPDGWPTHQEHRSDE